MKREHFITRQNVHNLARSISELNHSNDAHSVKAIVEKLATEQFNPVLGYKEFGVHDNNFPNLPTDSFLLILQTEHQKQMFQRHSARVVCVDSTHNTNQYDYKLIKMMIRDDYGPGRYKYLSINVYSPQLRVHPFLLLVTFFALCRENYSLGNQQQRGNCIHGLLF